MKRTHWLWFGLMLGVGLLGWWGGLPSARAGVITVCPAGCDYATIQGAVDAAATHPSPRFSFPFLPSPYFSID